MLIWGWPRGTVLCHARQAVLLDVARRSQIHVFGWPIGVTLDNRPEYRPRPTNEGIVAEVAITDEGTFGDIYDYWTWRKNGDFYLRQNLFEDDRKEKRGKLIYFETRIERLAEALLYCSRVYRRLGVPGGAPAQVTARWTGLKGRKLVAVQPARVLLPRETIENEVRSTLEVPLSRIRVDLVGVVKDLLSPLFMVFDFFQLSDQIYQEIIDGFIARIGQPRPGAQGARADMDHLRLEVEQSGNRWVARVYDMSDFMTVYETECDDEKSAKTQAVAFVLLNLGRRPQEGEPPEAVAEGLAWRRYSPV